MLSQIQTVWTSKTAKAYLHDFPSSQRSTLFQKQNSRTISRLQKVLFHNLQMHIICYIFSSGCSPVSFKKTLSLELDKIQGFPGPPTIFKDFPLMENATIKFKYFPARTRTNPGSYRLKIYQFYQLKVTYTVVDRHSTVSVIGAAEISHGIVKTDCIPCFTYSLLLQLFPLPKEIHITVTNLVLP